jgi:hypothetical protein
VSAPRLLMACVGLSIARTAGRTKPDPLSALAPATWRQASLVETAPRPDLSLAVGARQAGLHEDHMDRVDCVDSSKLARHGTRASNCLHRAVDDVMCFHFTLVLQRAGAAAGSPG